MAPENCFKNPKEISQHKQEEWIDGGVKKMTNTGMIEKNLKERKRQQYKETQQKTQANMNHKPGLE
jgi:hypothetical protein